MLLLIACSLWLSSGTIPESFQSPHAIELRKHRNDPPRIRIVNNNPGISKRALTKIVYGYLPYWISDTSSFRWNDLTNLGWFSIEVNSDGTLGNKHGWPDPTIIQTAHNAGVEVDLVFTLFGSTSIDTLLSSSSHRSTLITSMIDEMESGNADGINIDFEFVPSSAKDNFTTFLTELRSELDNRGHLTATISFAGPTSVSSGLDFPAIFDILDYYFIMAYGYHWSGSTYAGPIGQFRTDANWVSAGSLSLLRTIANITKAVGEDRRGKIIAGLPLYGREWTTSSASWPTQANSHIGSVTYSAARTLLNEGKTRYWDDGVCNPAIIWQEGGTYHQVWYDDDESLACKYRLALEQNIGGVGYWALGYDNGYSELWDLIEEYFSTPMTFNQGYRTNPITVSSMPFTDSKDTSTEGSRYFNYYSCNDALAEYGREFTYQIDICQNGTLTAHVNDDPNIDPDIHLLSAPSEEACIDRAHIDLSTAITPGRYYVVIDTYVNNSVEQEGIYNLNMDFTPEAGSTPCPSGTVCNSGSCVCDNGLTYCDSQCIDTSNDINNCGGCGIVCDTSCNNGVCDNANSDAGTDSGNDSGFDAATDSEVDSGTDSGTDSGDNNPGCETTYSCACDTPYSGTSHVPYILFLFISGFIFVRRFSI